MIKPNLKLPRTAFLVTVAFLISHYLHSAPRARDLGIPFAGVPGELNAITDVAGIEVGYASVIKGNGKLVVGEGPARTGVTAVFPRGRDSDDAVFAGSYALNGNGEMTGLAWVEESGYLEGPVMITNTHSVGSVHEAVLKWQVKQGTYNTTWSLPVVGETWDGYLNDINGFHVGYEHVAEAIESAQGGVIREGNVGGGTGMVCYEFKGGTGTASRIMKAGAGTFTVGVLVQANFGRRHQLLIGGIPIGQTLTDNAPYTDGRDLYEETGSIIAIVATDAPLLPVQLKRMATRVSLGVARTGSTSGNGSGDIFIAFSTANAETKSTEDGVALVSALSNDHISGLFSAVALATEEAIINALVAAETMTGQDDHTVMALPHEEVQELLRKHGRLLE